MRRLLVLGAMLAAATSPIAAIPTADRRLLGATIGVLDRVTLRVHWYESAALLRKAATERGVTPRNLNGFSILSRNVETGNMSATCSWWR